MLLPLCILVLLNIQFAPSNGDQLYKEGFLSQENLTVNTPYATDTTRFSDGITSSSAFDTVSPSFPYYRGYVANITDRYKRFTNYVESAAQQGISNFGAGDEVREVARLAITSKPNYEAIPAPTKTFTVYAAIKWNPSDFAIQEGETYSVKVEGVQNGYSTQMWYDGGIRVNSVGYSSYFDSISNCYVGMGRCRPHLRKRRRLPSAYWMSLVCSIGQFVRPLVEIRPGDEQTARWMPLDEAVLQNTVFDVGEEVTFRSKFTGQLICFANDAHSLYWNNKGQIEVTVTRASWPPESGSTYQALKLPSCDSARVVYINKGVNDNSPGKIKCNPNGGGTGWRYEDIINQDGGYGSGAPDSVYYDISDAQRNQ
jgi:hypothetical protein